VLAEQLGNQGASSFLGTDAGKALIAICGALALIIVVIGVIRMVNGIGRGRPGDAFRSLTFALIIGGLLFDLNLTISGVNVMSNITGKVFDSISDLVGSNSDGPGGVGGGGAHGGGLNG
jgi:hypothetical protein